jgi:hypothetical protein
LIFDFLILTFFHFTPDSRLLTPNFLSPATFHPSPVSTKKNVMRILIAVPFVLLVFCGCSKDAARGRLAIYKLSSFQYVAPLTSCRTDPATAVPEANPLVDDRDIIHYDSATHIYTFTPNAARKLSELPARTQLALTVDGVVVYTFNHQSIILSSICVETITMTIYNDEMRTNLQRYPGVIPAGFPGPLLDNRNDAKIIAVLGGQGKL